MRFYVPLPLADGCEIPLPDDVAHHLVRVLRAEAGTRLALFNGDGGTWEAELVEVGKKSAVARLLAHTADSRQSPLATHLGQVMSKGDRMDYAIQKATELGVTDITPLTSERCELRLRGEERADKKLEHWRRIAISACEQCGRSIPPRIHEPEALSAWSATVKADLRLVLAPSVEGALPDAHVQSVALLIGPEGGLSDTEIAAVRGQGFRPWQLGPRIMRTETAPVAALALLQARFGDL
ncbi:MAG TPA: 16S rRNA (uracil(1498)-N(3))-methyltransferase [Moraxellaceae bacterium]|nr:16S rRNA (uracil(1498)-N(3))-methyltransferase [Moraxellaceae bacterium]